MTLVSRVPVTKLVGLTKVEDCWSRKRRVLLFFEFAYSMHIMALFINLAKTAGWVIFPPLFFPLLLLLISCHPQSSYFALY
ncbi:hypothetical protein J3E73DRAFT_12296 [Bipolaris maydis]|nr:hypothetical protein J3E73DRAFT_12296 [Bipolaris maydis]